jgi:protein phosphatase
MLRVSEQASLSDTGRQRSANEDSFLRSAPLFAVADGMGGAQAGEVASRIAAESFARAGREDEAPEAYLREIAEEANRRIHRLAEADASRSGMGTTLTAALVEGDEISLAHVGDSRAYVFRDGALKQLTSDHSLVEELRRQGRLTDEQAAEHPQRSIITRALGPEPEVEVDTMTFRAKPGDVYLLCSDGLTTMIGDDAIARVLAEHEDLDDAVEELIRQANEAGGRDNITVIAFRLEEAEVGAEVEEGATLVGPAAEEAGLTAEAVRAASRTPTEERAALGGAAAAPAEPPRRRSRRPLKIALAAVVLALVVAGGVIGARQVYFLGADEGGRLSLYRGLPYDLPLGVKLYSEVYSAPVQVASIPPDRRGSAVDHTLRTHDDAVSLIDDLEAAAAPTAPVHPPGGRQSGNGSGGGQQGGSSRQGGSRQPGGQKAGGGGNKGGRPGRGTA